MKIIQIIPSLGNGGAEKLVVELSNELKARDHEVVIVSFRNVEDWMFPARRIRKDIKFIRLGKKNGLDIKLYGKLFRIIKREKPDVVHFHLQATLKYLVPLTFVFCNIRFIYTIHTKLTAFNRKYFEFINCHFYRFNKIKYVTLSKSIQHDFVNAFPRLAFSSISNGIVAIQTTSRLPEVRKEFNQYKRNKDSKIAIAIGSIVPAKNYGMMLEVFKTLASENIVAIVIGDLERADKKIFKIINSYKLDNIFFIGKRENVGDYISQADVFIMTSIFEGVPLTALEALSMGVPIVSTPAGGLVDIVEPDKNGFLSEGYTAESFVKEMKKFLSLNEEQLAIMKTNAKETFVNNYDIARCAANYLSVYKNR